MALPQRVRSTPRLSRDGQFEQNAAASPALGLQLKSLTEKKRHNGITTKASPSTIAAVKDHIDPWGSPPRSPLSPYRELGKKVNVDHFPAGNNEKARKQRRVSMKAVMTTTNDGHSEGMKAAVLYTPARSSGTPARRTTRTNGRRVGVSGRGAAQTAHERVAALKKRVLARHVPTANESPKLDAFNHGRVILPGSTPKLRECSNLEGGTPRVQASASSQSALDPVVAAAAIASAQTLGLAKEVTREREAHAAERRRARELADADWWALKGIAVGKKYMHVMHGLCTVVGVGHANKVDVEFAESPNATGELSVASYRESSWFKFIDVANRNEKERLEWARMRGRVEYTFLKTDVESQQQEALSLMERTFTNFYFPVPVTRSVLDSLRRSYNAIPLATLERGRVPSNGERAQTASVVEMVALEKAMQTRVLGYPLVCWSKRTGLLPSPFKRVYQTLCEEMPSHRLTAALVKTIFKQRRRDMGKSEEEKNLTQRVTQMAMGIDHSLASLISLSSKVAKMAKYVALDLDAFSNVGSADLPARKCAVNDFNVTKMTSVVLLRPEMMKLLDAQEKAAKDDAVASASQLTSNVVGGMQTELEEGEGLQQHGDLKLHGDLDVKASDAYSCAERVVMTRVKQSVLNRRDVSNVHLRERKLGISFPFDVYGKEMLKMTTTRMLKRAPCKSNNFKQAFARIFDTTAIRLFENIFWWVWSIEFQEGPSEEQLCVIRSNLRRVISQQYVYMVCRLDDHHGRVSEVLPKGHVRADALLKGNVVISSRRAKDLFFQYFPYALANAICWAFHFHLPIMSLAHRFDAPFKWRVYSDVHLLLTGVDAAPSTLRVMRERLFPDEDWRTDAEKREGVSPGPGRAPDSLRTHQYERDAIGASPAQRARRRNKRTKGATRRRRRVGGEQNTPQVVTDGGATPKKFATLSQTGVPIIRSSLWEAEKAKAQRKMTITREREKLAKLPEIAGALGVPGKIAVNRQHRRQMKGSLKGGASPLVRAFLRPRAPERKQAS